MMEIAFELLKKLWPYLLAASIGFGAAWYVQGVRVASLKNDVREEQQKLTDYKTEQLRIAAENVIKDDKRRSETEADWRKKYASLQKDSDIYKRCVASGKCGGLRDLPGSSSGVKLPSTIGVDATGSNSVPAAGESTPQVLIDCAVTTLQLNTLQEDIEKAAQ